jgi:hypothetical protein
MLVGGLVQHSGVGFGFLIRNGAVGEILFTQLSTERNIRYRKVSRGDRVGIDLAGAGILGVRQGGGRRRK